MRTFVGNTDIILCGGIPGVMFTGPFIWNEVRKHVEHLIEVWKGTRFLVGVADQVPANGKIECVKKISELLKSVAR